MGNLQLIPLDQERLLGSESSNAESLIVKDMDFKRPQAKVENTYGQMNISLDRAFYRPGDAIKGKITLKMKKPCPAKCLNLKIKGRETCVWSENDINERSVLKSGERAIFQHKLEIAKWTDYEIPEGTHVFRFKIYLKDKNLPGSVSFKKDEIRAKISYKLRADLQGPSKQERLKKSNNINSTNSSIKVVTFFKKAKDYQIENKEFF
jgi:hypothetical protein